MKIPKFSELDDKLQKAVKVLAALTVLAPAVMTGIKKTVPYIDFVVTGPELVQSVKELKEAVLVTNSALSAEIENEDSTVYKIHWKDHNYTGRVKKTKAGNTYVFVKDGEIGVQIFGASYDYDNEMWYFIDFSGNRIDLK